MTRRVVITDHALVRWLDRARGIDMEELRRELADIAQPYADACVKHAEVGGVWLIFDNGKLITVTPDKPRISQLDRHDRVKPNQTKMHDEGKMPWQAKKRRRDHR